MPITDPEELAQRVNRNRRLVEHARVELQVSLRLTEAEARALEALFGYGSRSLLDVFYEHLGKAYLKPHEQGFFSLADVVRTQLPIILDRATKASKVFTKPPEVEAAERRELERLRAVDARVCETREVTSAPGVVTAAADMSATALEAGAVAELRGGDDAEDER